MDVVTQPRTRTVEAVRLYVEHASDVERSETVEWLSALLHIRGSTRPDWEKVRDAYDATRTKNIPRKLLSLLLSAAYACGWRNRSWPARVGIGMVLGTVAAVGNQGAGIAALGGAVGLPLWIVLGAGGTVAGTVIQELQRARTS